MPWCPNCKAEYIDGITICKDCGTELVNDEEKENPIIVFSETDKEKFAEKFVQFLQYSDIDQVSYEFDEEKEKWVVLIPETSRKKVQKLYNAFYTVESEKSLTDIKLTNNEEAQAEETEEEWYSDEKELEESVDSEDDGSENAYYDSDPVDFSDDSLFDKEELQEIIKNKNKKPTKSATYVKKEDHYNDLHSSGITFLSVSVVGIIILILNALGIIHITSGLLTYIVMGGLFLVFIFIGISTLSNASKVKSQIADENRLTEEINEYLSQNVTSELLDSLSKEETNEEIQFFHKLENMKAMVKEKFGDLDETYLDFIVEEYYNSNFENE